MSTEAKEKIEDLNVIEEKDGSVTVDLPDHLADHSDDNNEPESHQIHNKETLLPRGGS